MISMAAIFKEFRRLADQGKQVCLPRELNQSFAMNQRRSLPGIVTVALAVSVFCVSTVAVGVEMPEQPQPLDCVINPSVVADLGSGVPGVLRQVAVDRSDFVSAGDVLARLDSGVESAARDLARVRSEKDAEVELRRVNAAFGERQRARSEDLYQRKVISVNDIDERKTEARLAGIQLRQALDNRELAALELERAEQVLQRRTIKSPISGVVMERFKTIGEYVDEKPVLRVAQLDPLYVEVFVPVERLGEVRPGMQARIQSGVVQGQQWRAQVSRVDRVADVASGTYGVRLTLPNPDYRIPAGIRCELVFEDAPALPVAEQDAGLPGVALTPENKQAVDDSDSIAQSEEPSTTQQLCLSVGPFDSEAEAQKVAKELSAGGLDVGLKAFDSVTQIGFMTVSEWFASRADALAMKNRLVVAQVDDHYLPVGNALPVRISLGAFKNRSLAERRKHDLANKGFASEVVPWTRGGSRYSLTVSGAADADSLAKLQRLSPADAASPDGLPLPAVCERLAAH